MINHIFNSKMILFHCFRPGRVISVGRPETEFGWKMSVVRQRNDTFSIHLLTLRNGLSYINNGCSFLYLVTFVCGMNLND